MEESIKKEVGERNPADVESLSVYNIKCQEIKGLTSEFKNLLSLSIINVGLKSLEGFPELPNLKRLELSDNKISDGLEALIDCPELEEVILVGNKVSDLTKLRPLVHLSKLAILDLFGCPVADMEGYRQSVFDLLPQLEILDGANKDGEDVDDEDDEDEEGPGLEYLTKSLGDEDDEEEDDYEPEDDDDEEADYTISDEDDNDLPRPMRSKADEDDDDLPLPIRSKPDEDDDDLPRPMRSKPKDEDDVLGPKRSKPKDEDDVPGPKRSKPGDEGVDDDDD